MAEQATLMRDRCTDERTTELTKKQLCCDTSGFASLRLPCELCVKTSLQDGGKKQLTEPNAGGLQYSNSTAFSQQLRDGGLWQLYRDD